jgi:uncharacterized protein (TIGR02145 family)
MRMVFAGMALVALIGCSGSNSGGGTTTGSSTSSSTGGSTAGSTTGSSTSSSTGGSTTAGTSSGSSTSSGSTGGTSTGGSTTGTASVTDARDGHSYPTVMIGTQTWLAANMDYEAPSGSFCYNNDTANCATDGRLYTFTAAAQACPTGWHLPSDDEWKTLETTLGMAADQLNIDGETTARGTNQGTLIKVGGFSGFDAKLAGYATGTSFYLLGTDGFFWTSTQAGSEVWRRHVDFSTAYLYRFQNPPASFAISVRCVM